MPICLKDKAYSFFFFRFHVSTGKDVEIQVHDVLGCIDLQN